MSGRDFVITPDMCRRSLADMQAQAAQTAVVQHGIDCLEAAKARIDELEQWNKEQHEQIVSITRTLEIRDAWQLADAKRYRAFLDYDLLVTFMGRDYSTKAALDNAIDAVLEAEK